MIESLSDIQRGGVSAFAGGSVAIASATVNVTPARRDNHTVNVVDAAVTPTSKIMCWLAPNADFDADDLNELTITAVPQTGSIDFTLCAIDGGAIVGDFLIYYMVG